MLPIHIEKLSVSEEAKKYMPPAAANARMMAARGLAPLSPVDMITVQVVLTADAEQPVAEAARQAVISHPEAILLSAVQTIKDPAILDFLAHCAFPTTVKEALLLNRFTPDDSLIHMAEFETDEKILDILSGNQKRMLACIDIAEKLVENPKLSFATRKRLEEFFVNDFAAQVLAEPAVAAAGADNSLSADFAAALAALPPSEVPPEGLLSAEDIAKELLEEKPEELGAVTSQTLDAPIPDKQLSVYKQILAMKVSHKIKLALKGNKEARAILVKESNKTVCTSVLKNSRITDGEVAAIASSKSSIEDLLRLIGANPAWMRSYTIKLALVNNPKTPFALCQKILPNLHDTDVALIAKSKGVSGATQAAARRQLSQKQKKH
jgi:hypothetical protein